MNFLVLNNIFLIIIYILVLEEFIGREDKDKQKLVV